MPEFSKLIRNPLQVLNSTSTLPRVDKPVRVALCDGEYDTRMRLSKAISANGTLSDAEVTEFSDGDTFLNRHAEFPFDIVFLDIQTVDGGKGLQGSYLHNACDTNAIIILLVGSKQRCSKTTNIMAFDYIMKSGIDEMISDVVSRAIRKLREQQYMVHLELKASPCTLDISKIVYLEGRDYRYITVFTKDTHYRCIGRLGKYEHRLVPHGFLRCHHDVLVNMNYIRNIGNIEITTVYDHILYMDVNKRQECLKSLNVYLTKHLT